MLEINSYEKQLNGLLIEREELFEQINELKNTIERQEIMIDKMKCCGNCKHDFEAQSSTNTKCCICTTKNYLWELKDE